MSEATGATGTATADAQFCAGTNSIKRLMGCTDEFRPALPEDAVNYVQALSNEELFPLGEKALRDIADDLVVLCEIRQRFYESKGTHILGYVSFRQFVEKNSAYSIRTIQNRLASVNGKDKTKVTIKCKEETTHLFAPAYGVGNNPSSGATWCGLSTGTGHDHQGNATGFTKTMVKENPTCPCCAEKFANSYKYGAPIEPASVEPAKIQVIAGEVIGDIKVWEDVGNQVESTDKSHVWIIEKLATGLAELWRTCDIRRLKNGERPKLNMCEMAYSTSSSPQAKEWGIAYWKGRTEWAQLRLAELKGGEPAPPVDTFTPKEPVPVEPVKSETTDTFTPAGQSQPKKTQSSVQWFIHRLENVIDTINQILTEKKWRKDKDFSQLQKTGAELAALLAKMESVEPIEQEPVPESIPLMPAEEVPTVLIEASKDTPRLRQATVLKVGELVEIDGYLYEVKMGTVVERFIEGKRRLPNAYLHRMFSNRKPEVGRIFGGDLFVHELWDKGNYDGSRIWLVENLTTGKAELWRSCDLTRIERKNERVNKCKYGAHRLYGGAPSPLGEVQGGERWWDGQKVLAQTRLDYLKGNGETSITTPAMEAGWLK